MSDTDIRPDRIVIKKDDAGEYRWTRYNGFNGEVTGASTEGYVNFSDALENITSTQGGLYTTEKAGGQS